HADSRWREIDIFSVVFIFEARRQKAHNVHLRYAAVAGQLAHGLALAHIIWNVAGKLAHHMAQSMSLLLPGNMACNAARVLDVLLTVEHFPDRTRFRACRIP